MTDLLDVGIKKQLFIDDLVIDETYGFAICDYIL